MLYELPKDRQLAANWHNGQGCPLYAFASTGSIVAGFDTAVHEAAQQALKAWHRREPGVKASDHRDLYSLYCEHHETLTLESIHKTFEFWNRTSKDSKGYPLRIRSNGQLKLWKTRPHDFRLPVKYGLRKCFYLTPSNINEWVPAL